MNNFDFYSGMSAIEFLRDVGKNFRVGTMLSRDSVKSRMEVEGGEGLSFTEFSYQVLQAYDFLTLNRTKNTRIQIGGSDQWGNIASGIDLVRRVNQSSDLGSKEVYGVTLPLLVDS